MLARAVLLAAAMVIIAPAGAPAQFTGVVSQPKKASTATTQATVAAQAASDSARETRLSDMKAWVDSAAGSLGVSTRAADTAAVPAVTVTTPHTTTSTGEVASMSAGVRAPDTASKVPLAALVGAVFLSAGVFLASTRPRRHEGDAPPTGM